MASPKEIRGKIKSVKNTQKITRAMEKVAMSKMRRANERMVAAKPYSEAIRRVVERLSQAQPEYVHPFMAEREVKRVAFLIVSSDRGLAGGLNMNVFRTAVREMRQYSDRGVETRLALIGSKGQAFFRRIGGKPLAQIAHLGDKPQLDQLLGIIKVVVDAYREGEVDRVYVVSNEAVNTMTQRPNLRQLLPLPKVEATASKVPWDYIYEPDVISLLDTVLTRYVESQVYQAVIENAASEQSARMVAMKSASDNASKIIGGLQLAYNKARQASITKELAEIVGGAAAV